MVIERTELENHKAIIFSLITSFEYWNFIAFIGVSFTHFET